MVRTSGLDEAGPPALRAVGITKSYGAVRALRGVSFSVTAGTIHGLCGENGAGKSTMTGIISGRTSPDEGTLEIFGQTAPVGSPHQARAAGIATIYQELSIVPTLSTQANLFLGTPSAKWGLVREKSMRRELLRWTEEWQVDIKPDVPAGNLSVADQQILEIMRAVRLKPRLILLDEPSAALTLTERRTLFRVMRQLRSEGVSQILVSHELGEVLDIVDAVTVFRDGEVVASRPVTEWTQRDLTDEIRGPNAHTLAPQASTESLTLGPVALRVEGLSFGQAGEGIDLTVHSGEIVGLAGMVGAGRTSTLKTLSGARRGRAKSFELSGARRRLPRTPRAALRKGIGLLPDDRKRAGILPTLSAASNIAASDIGKCTRWGILTESRVRSQAATASMQLRIPRERLSAKASTLSGGNQQKLLFARWLHRPVRVLLADEPTRGIDVGAKAEIAGAFREIARSGTAVVVTSTELDDLITICDRIVVLVAGSVVAELPNSADLTEARLLELALKEPSNA